MAASTPRALAEAELCDICEADCDCFPRIRLLTVHGTSGEGHPAEDTCGSRAEECDDAVVPSPLARASPLADEVAGAAEGGPRGSNGRVTSKAGSGWLVIPDAPL